MSENSQTLDELIFQEKTVHQQWEGATCQSDSAGYFYELQRIRRLVDAANRPEIVQANQETSINTGDPGARRET